MHSVTETLAKNMLTNYIEQEYNRSYNIFTTSIKSQTLNLDGLTTVIMLYSMFSPCFVEQYLHT